MAGQLPTPLPNVERLKIEDPEVRKSFEQILIYLKRVSSVIFDSSVEEGLGASITALQGRVKDGYTFPLGAPAVTDPSTPELGLEAVADSTLVEARVRFETPPSGQVTIQITVGGSVRGTLSVPGGTQVVSITSFTDVAVAKNQVIRPVVTVAPGTDPGTDAVVQVRCV